MPRLTAISGVGAKGPACFLVEGGGARILLDMGRGPDPGVEPDLSGVGRVDAVVLSHGHADHAGALDRLAAVGDPPVYATTPLAPVVPLRARFRALRRGAVTEVAGMPILTGRSGHAPGGVWLRLGLGDGLLYMGDSSNESTVYAFDRPAEAAVAIVDASYGSDDTPQTERVAAYAPVLAGGRALLPVPPGGRGPEMALHAMIEGPKPGICRAMRGAVETLLGRGRGWVQDAAAPGLRRLLDAPAADGGGAGIVIAGDPNAERGTAAVLARRWEGEAEPMIVFQGYLPKGSRAERLVASGRARHLRWNVHPRLSDNVAIVRAAGASTVVPAFASSRNLEAWQRAFAPARVVIDRPVEF